VTEPLRKSVGNNDHASRVFWFVLWFRLGTCLPEYRFWNFSVPGKKPSYAGTDYKSMHGKNQASGKET
jgi:hypothetical protein